MGGIGIVGSSCRSFPAALGLNPVTGPDTGSPRALLSPKLPAGLGTGQEEEEEGGWSCSCPDHPSAYLLWLVAAGDLEGKAGVQAGDLRVFPGNCWP